MFVKINKAISAVDRFRPFLVISCKFFFDGVVTHILPVLDICRNVVHCVHQVGELFRRNVTTRTPNARLQYHISNNFETGIELIL